MSFSLEFDGEFPQTRKFLHRASNLNLRSVLEKYGRAGVNALAGATPKDSNLTSESWTYDTEVSRSGARIVWSNTNVNNGVNIAVIIQTGHATRNGGYIRGIDYINPTLRPIFNQITEELWKEVTK